MQIPLFDCADMVFVTKGWVPFALYSSLKGIEGRFEFDQLDVCFIEESVTAKTGDEKLGELLR